LRAPARLKGAKRMPLSLRLRDMDLTLECKHCGWPLIKNGFWFITVSHFRREGCKREVRIPYDEKVALFERYAHLA
jgi:hypothetical protein